MTYLKIIADMLHLSSIIILFLKIRSSRNCIGISSKTQELYIIIFCLRYLDLFMYFVSWYNTIMKIAFIAGTIYTAYLIKYKKPYCTTYEPLKDDFEHFKYLLPLAGILTLIIHASWEPFELVWSFSIWLEAFAIMPQLHLLRKLGEAENITSHYIVALGLYRLFYIFNWYSLPFSNLIS